MSFDFYKTVIGGTSDTTFNFGRKFMLNGSSGQEPTYIDVILSGVSPLTLTKAKANGLNYVKVFGKTEQTNLPSGYTQKEYIQNGSVNNYNTKLDTGVMPEVGDVLEIIFTPLKTDTVSNYLLQSRYSSSGTIFGISGSQSDASIMATWGGVSVKAQTIVRQVNHKYYIKASFLSTGTTLYIKDLTTNEEETRTTELGETEPSANYWLFGNRGGQTLQAVYYTYLVKITNGDRVKLHYLPAVHDTAEGFYDLVTNTLKQADTGRFYASQTNGIPTPDTPINIVSNNGVVKVRRNLIDLNAVTDGYYYDPQGVYSALSNSRVTDYISIKAGQSITIYFKSLSTASNLNVRINIFNSNKVWQSQEVLQLVPSTDGTMIISPTYNGYIRVSGNYSGNAIVDWNTAKTVYGEYTVDTIGNAIGQIYTEGTQEVVTDSLGNTATAEMLLNVTITNNYTDTQEILTGAITRNTAIKVLDGTENWIINSGDYNFYRLNSAVNYSGSLVSGFPCTHFEPVSIASANNNQGIRINSNSLFLRYDNLYPATSENLPLFKQWLADQYANGTPVILVYPLATATTESVTGQTLSTKSGTNTITATGSLPSLELEVSFKQQQS